MKYFFDQEYQQKEEQQLIQDAVNGSKKALEQLIHQHYSFIYNVAIRYVLSPEDAEDLTQEVIIKVITKLSQFKQESSFRTWVYRIVFNHFLKSKKRNLEKTVISFENYGNELDAIPDIELNAEEQQSYKDLVEEAKLGCMTGMLLCLDRKQRLIYILGEMFEINSKIGAELLEISSDNFRKILSRARKDLYHFMNNKCGLLNKANPCRCPKKTKGFIQRGWIDTNELKFNKDFLKRVGDIAVEKANECTELIEEKYGALFKDHPYYNKNQSAQMMKDIVADKDLKRIFDL
jgi:RNA polymerase sigma factor (sigma-70 family)